MVIDMLDDTWPRKQYWVGLNMVLGVGKTLFHRLVRALGSPERVFRASRKELLSVEGIGPHTAEQILRFEVEKNIERERRRVEAFGARVLTWECPDYPDLLKTIYDPPPVLYYKGTSLRECPVPMAVVGTRNASTYGRLVAEKLCVELSRRGLTLVSGMARGIDTVAHKAALETGGKTLAVFGCGLEHTYPPENGGLRKRIMEQGAILSEFPMSTKPDRNNFPARNRVISGISYGTLVVEAGEKSGALITAQFALEQGRDVFAVPGNINSSKSKGTNRLIQMGAKLVDGPEAILEELPSGMQDLLAQKTPETVNTIKLTNREKNLVALLSAEEKHIDDLIQNSDLSPAEVSATLIELELKGIIRQTDGKMFVTNS